MDVATKKLNSVKNEQSITVIEEKIDENNRKIKIKIDPSEQDSLRDIKIKLAKDKKVIAIN